MAERTPNDARHIVLIGMRGSGKTTVGRLVAKALGREHVDTDRLVAENAGTSIAEIFAAEGEAAFRELERAAIATAVVGDANVISVGGGAVLAAQNVTALRERGLTFWLTAPPAVLYQRIQGDAGTPLSRPALSDLTGLAEVEAILAERAPRYRAAADIEVETAGRSLDEVASSIIQSAGVSHG